MNLEQWGFHPQFATELKANEVYARVVEEHRTNYRVITENGILVAQLPGKLLHEGVDRLEKPVVGDWLVVRPLWNEGKAVVQRVLPRTSLLKRKAAGEDESIQPLAANVDCTFIVTSLNKDLNRKRLHRYLTIAHESGSKAVVLLTKSDLEPNAASIAKEIAEETGSPCVSLSSVTGEGIEQVKAFLAPRETVVFVGSSGVGKSTLVNALLGEIAQETFEVGEDDKGRHTTTFRRLLALENGALVIDTPGMREIQLDSSHEEGISGSFAEIEELARSCKFSNCQHQTEPGCAVKAALESGDVEQEKYDSFLKLKRELAHQLRKTDKSAAAEEKKKWKSINKGLRQRLKDKGRKND